MTVRALQGVQRRATALSPQAAHSPTTEVHVIEPPLVHHPRGEPGTLMVFTGRAQGNLSMDVGAGGSSARARVSAEVGLDLDDAVFMEQVHGPGVGRVGSADRGRGARSRADTVPGVDALVTTDDGVALVVLVADCVPVLLAVPGRGVAAAHAGRAGVSSGVVGATVAALAGTTGAHPRDVLAVLGPAIGGCCYEVPPALALDVVASVPAARATTRWGTVSLDLPAAVSAQLVAAGVGHVENIGSCTRCDPQRWFSHRATGAASGPVGRQAGVVVMGAVPARSGDESSLH